MAFTVMGHAGVGFGTLDWLFPYDSYHMPLFVFISGYFFDPSKVCLDNTKNFFAKQLRRLVIPFFAWNLAYGFVSILFNSCFGIEWCHADEFWYRLLIRPFTTGNSFFEFNAPSWFILMLFEVKALNWLYVVAGFLVPLTAFLSDYAPWSYRMKYRGLILLIVVISADFAVCTLRKKGYKSKSNCKSVISPMDHIAFIM